VGRHDTGTLRGGPGTGLHSDADTAQTGDVPIGALPPPAPPRSAAGTPAGPVRALRRWAFLLELAAVWVVGAAAGVGLYRWWYVSLDKTPAVVALGMFLMVCTLGALLLSLARPSPPVGGLALAVLSAPVAAVAGAAVVHGLAFCEFAERCLFGLIPY